MISCMEIWQSAFNYNGKYNHYRHFSETLALNNNENNAFHKILSHNVKVWCGVVNTAYLKPGGDAAMSCNIVNLQFDTQPTKIVYKWINRNGLDMEAYPREGGRIKVTSHFELKIETAEPEDSDNYFCIVSMEYPDHVVNFTNELHFKGY